MKKRFLGLLLSVLLISVCVGCGAKNTTIEPAKTVETTTATQESTVEQTEEASEKAATETETAAIPDETTEPAETPEATEKPSEEVAAKTDTTEPAQAEPPTTEPAPQYTYTDMSATMYAQQTVNVRDLPDTSGSKLGGLSTNDEITITGQCNETSWYRFEYNGTVAYVSNNYVGENKVEIQQTPADSSSGQAQSPASSVSDIEAYPKGVFNDMGDWGFIIWDNSCGINYEIINLSGEPYNIFTERFPGLKVYCNAGFHIKNTNYACYLIYTEAEPSPSYNEFIKKYHCSCPTFMSHRYVFGLEFWNERPQ